MKTAAGTLIYRHSPQGLEVLLVHPSGAYNRHAPWSIPKGEPDADEPLEATARRETLEETGVVAGDFTPLGTITYRKSRKTIHCFAAPAAGDEAPHCASWEVDRAEFVTIDTARKLIHPDQAPFLERLWEQLRASL